MISHCIASTGKSELGAFSRFFNKEKKKALHIFYFSKTFIAFPKHIVLDVFKYNYNI